MKLKDRVRVSLDFETDNPPVGIITKLELCRRGTSSEYVLVSVLFDQSLYSTTLYNSVHQLDVRADRVSLEKE